MPVNTVTDWGDAVMTSLAAAMALFFGAIPKIIGFAVILIAGWFIASLVEKGIASLLRAVNFNELARKAGFSDFVHKMGVKVDAAGFLALVVKWFVRLIALVVAFDALGLPAVSEVLRSLLLWLPNLVVAMVVLVIGGLVAGAVRDLVRGAASEAEFQRPDLLARIAHVAVWAFAIVVAVNQLGIAATLVNTLFMAVVGAAAIALGLAFGLGGRDTAARIVQNWYERGQEAAPKLERAGEAMKAEGQRMAEQAKTATAQPAVQPAARGTDAGRTRPQQGGMPGGFSPQPAGQISTGTDVAGGQAGSTGKPGGTQQR